MFSRLYVHLYPSFIIQTRLATTSTAYPSIKFTKQPIFPKKKTAENEVSFHHL